MFRNREEAGGILAGLVEAAVAARGEDAVVLGIPRGGVVVARPVARMLGSPLDVIVPRKIGAPGEPELAVGALALAGDEEIAIFDHVCVSRLGIPREYLMAETSRQKKEIERRLVAYREGREPVTVAGRTVVIVDDGVATGLTAKAAAAAVARHAPREVVVAAPVAPPETLREFDRSGLRLLVAETPSPFMAVGQFYMDFRQVEDEEVCAILRSAG